VRSPIALREGESIGVGLALRLEVERDDAALATGPRLLVEDIDNGVQVPVHSDRVGLGTFQVLVDPDGQAWIGREDGSLDPVEVDESFVVDGRQFRVRRAPERASATWDAGETRYPIRVMAELAGPTGPRATLTDVTTGASVDLGAENRAILVYVLARHLRTERAAGIPERDAGWCADHEVASQVWGRLSTGRNLNVLITRVRNDLRRGGIDPWCLEKRRGFVRLRVETVEVRE
jgi:hypothetical protein